MLTRRCTHTVVYYDGNGPRALSNEQPLPEPRSCLDLHLHLPDSVLLTEELRVESKKSKCAFPAIDHHALHQSQTAAAALMMIVAQRSLSTRIPLWQTA